MKAVLAPLINRGVTFRHSSTVPVVCSVCGWTFHMREFKKALRVDAPLRDFAPSITKLRNLLRRLVAEGFALRS